MTSQHESKEHLLLDMSERDSELLPASHNMALWKNNSSYSFGGGGLIYSIRYPKQLFKRFLYALVPSFIRTTIFNDSEQSSRPVSSTAWMDGLRGFGALAVFNEHYLYNYTYTIADGYGRNQGCLWFHQMPVFYLSFDGSTFVIFFFTIAGYVSSYKALQRMTIRDHQGLFNSMPGSVFRKWFRLYLPVICSTLTISIVAYLGLFEPARYLYDSKTNKPLKKYFDGTGTEPLLPQLPTLVLQLRLWIASLAPTMAFWTEFPQDPEIDHHLWTIVYEFRSCMHLFVTLLALAQCKPWIRIAFLLLLGYVYAFWWQHWEGICFFYGAVLAQIDILRQLNISQGNAACLSTRKPSYHELIASRWRLVLGSQPMRTFGYCLALYLASYPFAGDKHGGGTFYVLLVDPWLPSSWFKNKRHKLPKQIAVLLFMFLLLTIPAEKRNQSRWHRMLTSKFALYLGKTMFALYLIHGLILHVVGYQIPLWVWKVTSSAWDETVGLASVKDNNNGEFLFGLFIGWIISLALSFWAADVWEREVERRCVRLTKWLESVCFESGERSPPYHPSSVLPKADSTNGPAMPVKFS